MSRRRPDPPIHGALVVDKDEGPTSHDLVAMARRALGMRRIGHTGTLDPMATGVLVLLLGQATRLAPQMTGHVKVYSGEGRLGFSTDTYDRTGTPSGPQVDTGSIADSALQAAAARLTGRLQQAPPPYSARKVDGVPLYRLARAGRPADGRPVEVEVEHFQLKRSGPDRFNFAARVSAGTYIRSLVHDLGQALGCGAHLTALRRTQAGPFPVASALAVASLQAGGKDCLKAPCFHPFNHIPLDLPAVQVDPDGVGLLRQGLPAWSRDEAPQEQPLLQARDPEGRLVALVDPDPGAPGRLRPRRVFPLLPEL